MPKNLTATSAFTAVVPVPVEGDPRLSTDIEAAVQALMNRTLFLDDRRTLVDVEEHGAVGDGVTDDFAAITAAIAACPAGGEVVFRAGKTYGIAQTIELDKMVRLRGEGVSGTWVPGSRLKALAGFTGDYMIDVTHDDASIASLYFLGDSTVGGIYVHGDSGSAQSQGFVTRINISECIFSACDTAILFWYAGVATARNCVASAGTFTVANGSTSIVFDNCYSLSTSGFGFSINDCQYITLIGCAADDHQIGYWIGADARSVALIGCGAESLDYGFAWVAGRGVTFSGCFGHNNGSACESNNYPVSGIQVSGQDVTITDFYDNAPAIKIWTNGQAYTVGQLVSNGGRTYELAVAGGGNVANAPVHVAGTVALADGYAWLHVRATTRLANMQSSNTSINVVFQNGGSFDLGVKVQGTRTILVNAQDVDQSGYYFDALGNTTGAAAPTTGTWRKGQRCMNNSPDPGEASGWVCTTAGTPGTWKELAPISL